MIIKIYIELDDKNSNGEIKTDHDSMDRWARDILRPFRRCGVERTDYRLETRPELEERPE